MSATSNHTSRRGMTLIELLIVLAIISILTAILFPAIARSREAARTTACLSNLQQLGKAIAIYQTDYDGYYPYGLDPYLRHPPMSPLVFAAPKFFVIAQTMPDMRDVLRPYVTSNEVYHCPSEHEMYPPSVDCNFPFAECGSSYHYNPYPAMLRENESHFIKPAEAFLMSDITYWHSGSTGWDGRLNELFADYHAKNVSWEYWSHSDEDYP